jgi:hypothetical protein
MAKASSTKRGASQVSIRRFITLQAKLAAREVVKESQAAGKGGEKSLTFPYEHDDYLDSPERDILTPKGLRLLLGDVGEKTITRLVNTPGFPFLKVSNSYRFHRGEVLAWCASKSTRVPESGG